MATKIGWTTETWNPTTGCDRISPGCDNCYALTLAKRLKGMGQAKYQNDGDPRTSGPGFALTVHPTALDLPLTWRKPRVVFVNSMSDLFHRDVPAEFIAEVFAVMASAPQHTFQVLTKRPQRMLKVLCDPYWLGAYGDALLARGAALIVPPWPLPNVWLGTSVENQRYADLRVPHLLETPAAVRFLSVEPLLGPVDLGIGDPHRGHQSDDVNGYPHPRICLTCSTEGGDVEYFRRDYSNGVGIDWVIVGGESGPGHRDMHPDWLASIAVECQQASVPLFVKQDSHHLSEQQGRIPDELWARKEFPAEAREIVPR